MTEEHAKEHRQHVIKALLSGEAVPVEVMADYPDLYEFHRIRDEMTAEMQEDEVDVEHLPLSLSQSSEEVRTEAMRALRAQFPLSEYTDEIRLSGFDPNEARDAKGEWTAGKSGKSKGLRDTANNLAREPWEMTKAEHAAEKKSLSDRLDILNKKENDLEKQMMDEWRSLPEDDRDGNPGQAVKDKYKARMDAIRAEMRPLWKREKALEHPKNTVLDAANAHLRHVERAIASGKKISPDVLADYPDLQG